MFADIDCARCGATFRHPLQLAPVRAACPQCGAVTALEKPTPARRPTTAIRDGEPLPVALPACPVCSGTELQELVLSGAKLRRRAWVFGFLPVDLDLGVRPLVCLDCGHVALFVTEEVLERLRKGRS